MTKIFRVFARLACLLLSAQALALPGLPVNAGEVPVIAAAADLKFALTDIADSFSRETGKAVKLSFGSSGNFARQILQGAPFELFLSADEGYIRFLSEKGLAADDGVLYAIGRIVLFIPKNSSVKADPELSDLTAALKDGRLRRIAIANPEHAPYGRAAREALAKAGVWDGLQGRLVLGENATQTAQFATSGSVDAAIMPYSLALAPAVSALGEFALISENWHQPLRQRMVLLKGAGDTARSFYVYLQQPPARAIFRRYGFLLPGEGK